MNPCYNDHNNEYNIKLYNLVWNNIYIKRIILNHLNIFNILLPIGLKFNNIIEWDQFKYKDYLNEVNITFDIDLNKVPDNIRIINFDPLIENDLKLYIPNQIESFSIRCSNQHLNIISPYKLSTKLKTLYVKVNDEEHILSNQLPGSITCLNIFGKHKIRKNVLPINLKRIVLQSVESFEDDVPISLVDAILFQMKPIILNSFKFSRLVKLNYSSFEYTFNNDIELPNTLKELTISCKSFNTLLPNSLTSLSLHISNLKSTIQFPSSLEQLKVCFIMNSTNIELFQFRDLVPINLKSLELTCSTIEDINGECILPFKLEKLILSGTFNNDIKVNQLPPSLTYLDLGSSFNRAIDIDVLPQRLKYLTLGYHYTHIINSLAIPSNLKLLFIRNDFYQEHIHISPYSMISCHNLNLYYDISNTDIRVLRLPRRYNLPLSTLQLQDKSKLEYLHLGESYNQPIQQSDLPLDNQIKTLELNYQFQHTINLKHFQNLETIIVSLNTFNLITTINQYGVYNFYNLKQIKVPPNNKSFIMNLNCNFYKYIQILKQ